MGKVLAFKEIFDVSKSDNDEYASPEDGVRFSLGMFVLLLATHQWFSAVIAFIVTADLSRRLWITKKWRSTFMNTFTIKLVKSLVLAVLLGLILLANLGTIANVALAVVIILVIWLPDSLFHHN